MAGSYAIADFLPFDHSTWVGLVASVQQQWWPVHLGLALLMVAAGWHARRSAGATAGGCLRWPLLAALALPWLWTGWAFHWRAHGTLNWAAGYWAGAFAAQGLLLLGLAAMMTRRARRGCTRDIVPMSGPIVGLFALALVAPAAAGVLLGGREPAALEWFAYAPDPLAWLTLLLLGAPQSSRAGLSAARAMAMVVPLLSLLLSGLAGYALDAAEIWSIAAIALLSWVFLLVRSAMMRTVT